MSDDEGIGRALEEFREVLERPAVGVLAAAQLDRLRELIERYPDEAEQMIAKQTGAV